MRELGRVRALFLVVAAAHLVVLAVGAPSWADFVTKASLMPVLAWWVYRRGGARLVIAALLLSAGGDIALEFDGLFIVGMGFFGAAHVCYVTFFGRSFAAAGPRKWVIAGGYAIMWAVLIAVLWPRLGDLRIPVAVYSLLLTSTAVASAGHGLRTGIGGALFLISDALIALGITDRELPMHGVLVMLTYISAQYLLASGSLTRSAARPPVPV
ncbi:putative membrane protein YhhN [Actinocorallia herbida]|uniref:Putative membrane protein YhhN n=1 Tax=Actinocorallia herbida TaxID=58109 RepID=A0A3N1DAH3_9ACTN|nr:lysoplasmalogenase [Actinocorallia herbida]ROO90499.1 putative membrane protein YhhN [Actinocorallia herbida]